MYNYSLADKFVIMAILTLPYDAIPHILPFVYRPLSLYFIGLAFVVYLVQDNFRFELPRPIIQILIFALVTVSIGGLVLFYNTGNFTGLKYYVPSFAMGILSVITFSKFLAAHADSDFIYIFLKFAGLAYIPAMFLGTLETLSNYHILPYVVKSSVNAVFGGWQPVRPCLTNSEASSGSVHMCFAFFVYRALYEKTLMKKWRNCSFFAILLLLFTVSTKGYTVFILTFVFYTVISNVANMNFGNFLKKILLLTIVLILFSFAVHQIILLNPDAYYSKRILNFISVTYLIENDSSAFVRIGIPMLAFKMFLNHPFLGLGAGGSHVFMLDYIRDYASYAMNFGDVLHMRKTGVSMSTSVSFQVLACFGIYEDVLFIISIGSIWVGGKNKIICSQTMTLLFALFIVFFFQSGNWAYMQIWYLFALFSSLPLNTNKPVKLNG